MMGSKTYQLDDVRRFIYPNQQEIVLNMAFHITLVVSTQFVRFILNGYRNLLLKILYDCQQLLNFFQLVSIAFEIFLELRAA